MIHSFVHPLVVPKTPMMMSTMSWWNRKCGKSTSTLKKWSVGEVWCSFHLMISRFYVKWFVYSVGNEYNTWHISLEKIAPRFRIFVVQNLWVIRDILDTEQDACGLLVDVMCTTVSHSESETCTLCFHDESWGSFRHKWWYTFIDSASHELYDVFHLAILSSYIVRFT